MRNFYTIVSHITCTHGVLYISAIYGPDIISNPSQYRDPLKEALKIFLINNVREGSNVGFTKQAVIYAFLVYVKNTNPVHFQVGEVLVLDCCCTPVLDVTAVCLSVCCVYKGVLLLRTAGDDDLLA